MMKAQFPRKVIQQQKTRLIDKFIQSALAGKYKLMIPNAQTPRVAEIGQFLQSVISKVGARTDSPLE